MTFIPPNSPLAKCRAELAKKHRTIGGLVRLNPQVLVDHYGVTLDEAKYERERAITERGGKPWELLKGEN